MDLKGLFVDSSPERVVQRAQKLAMKGRPDQAIAVIEEAIQRLGESADLRIEQATQLLTLGKVRPAADALRALMKVDAGATTRVEEFIGWARTRSGDIDPLHEVLAEGYIARRRFQDARQCFESVDRGVLRGDLETRLANLNRFLETGAAVPKSATQTLWFGALGYEVIEDWHRAFDSYRKVLAANPADLGAVEERLRGLIARNFKAVALRLAFAEMLLTAGHKERGLQEYMGAIEVDKRCASQVRRVVETMLETAPDDDKLLWAKVRVCVGAGALDEAFAACDRLIERKAQIPEIESLLSELSSAGKDTTATKLMAARVAVRTGKAARATSAIVAAFAEDPGPRGLEILNEVIVAFPREARPRLIQAEHLFKGGKLAESLEAWRAVKNLDAAMGVQIASRLQSILMADPDNAQVLQLLEEVCTESGEVTAAVPFLRKRLREHPESAGAVLERLRQLSMAAPEDPALWLAMTEAHLTAGDCQGAWNRLAMLLERGMVDRQTMHLLVLTAGSSAALFQQASSFVSSIGRLSEIPAVVFALGESAGRAGLLREAIDRFRMAATSCPPAAAICMKAIRDLGRRSAQNDDDRAALAEALIEARDMEGVNEVLARLEGLTPAAASRLIARLDAALKTDPADLWLCEALARVCLVTGQLNRALEVSRSAASGRDDAASARLTMTYGDAAARSGDLREGIRAYAAAVKRDGQLAGDAIDRLRRLLTIDMGLETAHLALGRMLIAQGNFAEGINSLMTSASIKPQLAPVVLKDLEATARRYPGDCAIDFARSGLLLAAGDPIGAARCVGTHLARENAPVDEILARLEGIAARHGDSAPVMLELGRACHRKGWAERATACMKAAYSLDRSLAEPILVSLAAMETDHPREAGLFLTRGLIHEEDGRPLPAADAYLRAVGLGGHGTVALEGLRRLCRDADRATDTAARLEMMLLKACAILGEVDEAIQAGDAVLAGGPDRANEVLTELDRILTKNPGHVRAMLSRARCQLRLEDLDGAIAGLATLLERDRSSCAAEVTRLARQALDRRPTSVPAARLLADALRSQGSDEEAIKVLDSILATPVGGADAEILLLRRSMAVAQGDDATALALLSRAESVTTDRDRLLELLHREVLARASGTDAHTAEAIEAVQAGRFLQACASAEGWKPSTLKAWVFERSGRAEEAAACLREIIAEPAAAERFAAVHDAIVSRQIEGKAPVLMADVPLGARRAPAGTSDDTIDRRYVRAEKGGAS